MGAGDARGGALPYFGSDDDLHVGLVGELEERAREALRRNLEGNFAAEVDGPGGGRSEKAYDRRHERERKTRNATRKPA